MKIATLYLIIILTALIENLSQTWLSINGITIPLTLIVIGVLSFQLQQLAWLGLVAGLVLDITSINTLGANTLYYFVLTSYLDIHTSQEIARHPKRWWYKPMVLALAGCLHSWYLIAINGQFGLASYETAVISLVQFAVTLTITGLLFALLNRSKTTSYKILR